jgi:hypothetical protein
LIHKKGNKIVHKLFGGFLTCFVLTAGADRCRAQALDGFNWVNEKTDTATMASVAHILRNVDYTSIVEVAYITPINGGQSSNGADATATPVAPVASASLQRDSHMLAVVAKRPSSTALPNESTISVYDLSLKYETAKLLLSGAGLRFAGWLRFTREDQPELVATYEDCAAACQKTTFFTAFYLDQKTREWKSRWPRSIAGAPIFSEGQEANGGQQVYALMVDDTGRAVLGAWQHYSGRTRRDSDYVFAYHLTQWTLQDVTETLSGASARTMETRLCRAQDEALGIAGGQDSPMCKPGSSRPEVSSVHQKR